MPVTAFVKSFGSFSYAAGQIGELDRSYTFRPRVATPANYGGQYDAGPLFDTLAYAISGRITATNLAQADPSQSDSFRAAWRSAVAAHTLGTKGQFKIDSDCYANMTVQSISTSDWTHGMPTMRWSAVLVSREDPPIWATATTTVTGLTYAGSPNALTIAGDGPCDPIITLVVTAAPGGGLITIVDVDGNTFTLAPNETGTYIINSVLRTVTRSGVSKSSLRTGRYPRLKSGTNSLTITLTGGATLSAASLDYQPRYYAA